MNKIFPAALAVVAIAGGAFYLTRPTAPEPIVPPAEGEPLVSITVPETLSAEAMMGQRAFEATCADCHGANPRMDVPGIDSARRLDMAMEGGAMGRMSGAIMNGRSMGFREMAGQGQFWALSGQVGMTDTPFASLDRGETVRVKLTNDTAFAHAMHLHGMHFRQVAEDGSLGPMRDTILSYPDEPLEIAFVADNPGKWLFHCHMLGHAASGMTTWINVS